MFTTEPANLAKMDKPPAIDRSLGQVTRICVRRKRKKATTNLGSRLFLADFGNVRVKAYHWKPISSSDP